MARGNTETPDYAKMLGRMIRAHARRVADGDEVDLADMLQLREVFDDAIRDAVWGMRDDGIAWSYIALGAGVSRQAAQQRWGPYP